MCKEFFCLTFVFNLIHCIQTLLFLTRQKEINIDPKKMSILLLHYFMFAIVWKATTQCHNLSNLFPCFFHFFYYQLKSWFNCIQMLITTEITIDTNYLKPITLMLLYLHSLSNNCLDHYNHLQVKNLFYCFIIKG